MAGQETSDYGYIDNTATAANLEKSSYLPLLVKLLFRCLIRRFIFEVNFSEK